MVLTTAIEQARRQTATRANRERQNRAELRLTEIIKVAGIADDFERADRKGDLRIESAFAALYQASKSENLRELVVDAFVAWQQDEAAEEAAVRGGVNGAVLQLKANNPVWLNGAAVPADSDAVA